MTTVWINEEEPSLSPGYYAVLICWDSHEGMFPNGAYFDGRKWVTDDPVVSYMADRFDTEQEARDHAYKHDPDEQQ